MLRHDGGGGDVPKRHRRNGTLHVEVWFVVERARRAASKGMAAIELTTSRTVKLSPASSSYSYIYSSFIACKKATDIGFPCLSIPSVPTIPY